MRCLLALCLVLLGAPSAGWAGAWPREKGQMFVATGGTYRYAPKTGTASQEGGIYVEYGLGRRITIGFDAMDDQANYGHARLFVRVPLSVDQKRLKLAFTFGAGAARLGPDWAPAARLAVSIGRDHGLWRGGWWNLTLGAEGDRLRSDPLAKLDAGLGLNVGERLDLHLKVEASDSSNASPEVKLIPGVIWRMTPAMRLHVGIEARHADQTSYGLRAGIWREF